MRQLTLTSLAVEAESGEVPFSTLFSQLDLPKEDLELFLIDGELNEFHLVFKYFSLTGPLSHTFVYETTTGWTFLN